jgi:CheY-like chemotaxis protein
MSEGTSARAGSARDAAAPGDGSVLVVDDDPVAVAIATSALSEAGFRALSAGDALAGFVLLETTPDIALMIIDVVLPGIDGLMLADMVKRRHPDMRIIYATGFPEVAERQPGYRYGPMLVKPLVPDDLAGAVRQVLAQPPDRLGYRPAL